MMEKQGEGKNKKRRGADWEKSLRLRRYFSSLFTDTTETGEKRVILFCKKILFWILLAVEVLILLQHVELYLLNQEWVPLVIMCGLSILLTGSQLANGFFLEGSYRTGVQFSQTISVCGFLILTEGVTPFILYLLMLTQLYLDLENGRVSMGVLIGSLFLYSISYSVRCFYMEKTVGNLFEILREAFASLAAIGLHYFLVQFLLTFYRQYLQLNRTLVELDESKRELEKAYEVVKEVSALEERQRIAKEIHDTAGHSLTTVIMQTERAKRIIEEDPNEAKMKIIAANLQAKTTLERLRESVHLLSGNLEGETLKTSLEAIIRESTDGTGIRIRSMIEDMVVSQEKKRLLCNALREGISNAFRHGSATAFWFEVKQENGKIEFLLSDNGKGLSMDELKLGFGLSSMQENVKKLGGEVHFDGEMDEGLEIKISLPI